MLSIINNFFSKTVVKVIFVILLIGLFILSGYELLRLNNELSKVNNDLNLANNKIKDLVIQNGNLSIELSKSKNDYMELESNSKVETVVKYVEKSNPNDADIQLINKPPKVVVTAGDGKSYDFTPNTSSAQTIKDGKVILTEDNILHLDIEKIVDARFKDKVEAIDAKHKLEIDKKNEEIDKINRVLKRTRKQRDFYVGTAIIGTGVGMYVGHRF